MNRRRYLTRIGTLAGGISLSTPVLNAQEANTAFPETPLDIKITKVLHYPLRARISEPFGWSTQWTQERTAEIFEVRTNRDIIGWGEGYFRGSISNVDEWLQGKNPFQLESINQGLRRFGGATLASGIDNALWDIIGKVLGLPIHAVLGNTYRDKVLCYATGLYRKKWPDFAIGLQDEARSYVDQGFTAMKMKIGYGTELDLKIVRAVREAIGTDIKLGVDAVRAYDSGTAVSLGSQLEEFNLMFLEEPVSPNNFEAFHRLKNTVRIPLASGESGSYETGAPAVNAQQLYRCCAAGCNECRWIEHMPKR